LIFAILDVIFLSESLVAPDFPLNLELFRLAGRQSPQGHYAPVKMGGAFTAINLLTLKPIASKNICN